MNRTRTLPALVLGAGVALLAGGVFADALVGTAPAPLATGQLRSDAEALGRGQSALRTRQFDQAEKAFGEAPGHLVGIAIMTDTDNTRSHAKAWYGDIRLD